MHKLTHHEIVNRQAIRMQEDRLRFTVVLNNIRSLYNVGSIFRSADGAGIEKIWICGITGHPPSPMISKTALGAEEHVPWEYREDVRGLLRELKARQYQVVTLEQTEESRPYETFTPEAPVCLVVGNEIEGVSASILSLCDAAVEIEMAGIKNSLNVSVAFGVVAYRFRQCLKGYNSTARSTSIIMKG